MPGRSEVAVRPELNKDKSFLSEA